MTDTPTPTRTTGESTLVEGIADLARQAAGVRAVAPVDGGYLAVPDGVRVIPEAAVAHPGLLDTPEIGRVETVLSPTAFVEFVTRFGSDQTVVFVDARTGRAQAILNYVPARRTGPLRPDADGNSVPVAKSAAPPAYRFDWRVEFEPTPSPEWATLASLAEPEDEQLRNAALLSLRSVFVEGFARDAEGREPPFERMSPLDLLELATGHRQATGADLVGAMTGAAPIAEPLIARFRMPVLRGGTSTPVLAMVKAVPRGGFSLAALDPDRVTADARAAAANLIASALGRSFGTFEVDLDAAAPETDG